MRWLLLLAAWSALAQTVPAPSPVAAAVPAGGGQTAGAAGDNGTAPGAVHGTAGAGANGTAAAGRPAGGAVGTEAEVTAAAEGTAGAKAAAGSTLPGGEPAAASAGVKGAPSAAEAMRAAAEKQRAAAARQMESARRQAQGLGALLMPGGDGSPLVPTPRERDAATPEGAAGAKAPEADCDAVPEAAADQLLESAARAQSLEPKLLRAVVEQESAWRPCALSAKGAKGLMQLMPDTAALFGVRDPFDARENLDAGAKYLKQLLDKYGGDLAQALGAYNAGPGTVDQNGGVPNIKETQDYVSAILKKLGRTAPDPGTVVPPKPVEN